MEYIYIFRCRGSKVDLLRDQRDSPFQRKTPNHTTMQDYRNMYIRVHSGEFVCGEGIDIGYYHFALKCPLIVAGKSVCMNACVLSCQMCLLWCSVLGVRRKLHLKTLKNRLEGAFKPVFALMNERFSHFIWLVNFSANMVNLLSH